MTIDPSHENTPSFGDRLVRGSETFFRALLWLLVAYSFAVWVIALVDWFRHPLAPSPYNAFGGNPAFRAFALFVGAPFVAFLGFLILKRQRQNLIGLLLLSWAGGLVSFGISVAIPPALYDLVSLPIAAWWTSLLLTPFYFPDGHAYPRWLSPILPAFMVLALASGGASMLAPARLSYAGEPANPFFVTGAQAISNGLTLAYIILVMPLIVGVFVSPLLRYRRADAVQRRQIKWFAFWSAIVFTPYLLFYFAMGLIYREGSNAPPWIQAFAGVLIGLIGFLPPLIIAISILRYRLYDIDIIIRKTLQYTAVTALLALIYFGSVFLLQRLFSSVTGQQSPLALVVSTLLIAARDVPIALCPAAPPHPGRHRPPLLPQEV